MTPDQPTAPSSASRSGTGQEEGGGPETPQMRGRRWLLVGGAALALVSVLSVAALFVGTRFLDPEQLAAWLEPKIEEALGRDVNVRSARVALFPPVAVALEGLEVANPEGFRNGTFARIAELRLDLELMQLLRRNISIDEIRLASPEIDILIAQNGTSNAEGLGARSENPASEPRQVQESAPFQVGIESIRIDNGSLTYSDQGKGTAVVVSPMRARFRVRTGPDGQWLVSGDSQARVGARTAGTNPTRIGPVDVQVETSGEASNDLKTLSLSESTVEIEELLLALAADVVRADDGSSTVDLRVTGEDLPIERTLSLLPDSLTAQLGSLAGLMSADISYGARFGSASGSDHAPELLGQITLADVSVEQSAGVPLVSALNGGLNLSLDSVWTTNLEGALLGGSARMRALVRLGDEGGFAVRVAAQPDLGQVGSVVTLPDSVTLGGGMSLDITARGTLDDPAAASLTGRAVPEGVSATLPGIGVPIGLPEGTILLDGDVIRWRDLPILLGEDRFTSTGELRDVQAWAREGDGVPALGGSFTGDRFDYDAVFPGPPPDSMVLYG
ncbi:MAG: AsmA family protein, partial [Longimicrobiales bacterium]